MYLLIFFVVLSVRYPKNRTRAMKHLLRFLCVVLCVIFLVRYTIQFSAFITKIGSKLFPSEFVDGLDLYAMGLQKYEHPKLLFVYVLAQSVLMLMILLEVKIISKKLSEEKMMSLVSSSSSSREEEKEEEEKVQEEKKSVKVRRQTTTALLSSTPVKRGHRAKKRCIMNENESDGCEDVFTIRVNIPVLGDGRREICEYVVYNTKHATTSRICEGILKSFFTHVEPKCVDVTLYDSNEKVVEKSTTKRLSDFVSVESDHVIIRAIVRLKGGDANKLSHVRRIQGTISKWSALIMDEIIHFVNVTSPFWVVVTALCVALRKVRVGMRERFSTSFFLSLSLSLSLSLLHTHTHISSSIHFYSYTQVDGMRFLYVIISLIYLCGGSIRNAARVLFLTAFVVAMCEYLVQLPLFLIDHDPFWKPGNVTTWIGLNQLKWNDGYFNSTDPNGNVCRAEILEIGFQDFMTLFGRIIDWFGSEIALSVMCAVQWWSETWKRKPSKLLFHSVILRRVWSYIDHILCLVSAFVILIAGADHLSAVSLIYLSMSLVFFVVPNMINANWIMRIVAMIYMIQYIFILGLPFLDHSSERGFCSQIQILRENSRWQVWLCGVGVVNDDEDKIGHALVTDLFCVLFVWLWWRCVVMCEVS